MTFRRIMVVDDNDDDLFFAQIILNASGIAAQVELIGLARQALALLASPAGDTVDLVLLDINMPEMDGFEFLDLYQPLVDQGLARAPVLMHSSSTAPADRARAASYACVKGYLTKPITRDVARSLASMVGPADRAGGLA